MLFWKYLNISYVSGSFHRGGQNLDRGGLAPKCPPLATGLGLTQKKQNSELMAAGAELVAFYDTPASWQLSYS